MCARVPGRLLGGRVRVNSQLFTAFIKDLQKFASVKKSEDLGPLVADLEAQIKALRERQSDALQNNTQLEDENARLKAMLAEANRDRDRFKGRCSELEAQSSAKDKQIKRLETERNTALGDADRLLGQLEELRRNLDPLEKRLADVEAQRDKAKADMAKLSGALAEMRKEKEDWEIRFKNLETDASGDKWIQTLYEKMRECVLTFTLLLCSCSQRCRPSQGRSRRIARSADDAR